MSIYSMISTAGVNRAVRGSSSGDVRVVSIRGYGEDASVTAGGIALWRTQTAGSGVTPEKFNSRSPATTLSNSDATDGTTFLAYLLYLDFDSFSHSSWISTRLTSFISNANTERRTLVTGGLASTAAIVFSDDSGDLLARRIARRTTKPGAYCRFGNECHLHKKTGSGAFEMTSTPHFDNDIAWTDSSAWKNGMAQSDAWSMQLFGDIPPPDPIGIAKIIPQSVQRAATF